ncbi:MAG: gamma-glutamyltransferase [Gammaproteobacteria bacterium]|nr:gamma-glutamyltransferase [Gammaproteobacteria bacterium]
MVDHGRRPVSRKAPWWSLFVFCVLAATASAVPPRNHAIVSAHPLASEAGRLVIEAGGNAFDAAVAVSAALAVVEPYGSGLGGGGFWLLHRAADRFEVMIDGRERAPAAATADMYLDANGQVVDRASIDGPLAAGIPGVPAALAHIAENYGRLPLAMSLQPAIILARDGFPVDAEYRRMAEWRIDALRASPAAAQQLLVDGEVPPLGHRLRQPTLAATLQALAGGGAAAFYAGDVAQRLVDAVRAAGGIWSLDDLRDYRVVERAPVELRLPGNRRLLSASLPSSGGVLLAEMLMMLDQRPSVELDAADRVHLLVEVMRRAYADRARFLGDSDHVHVPLAQLLNRGRAQRRVQQIDMHRATPSTRAALDVGEGQDTTHFSILDREGNRVAATLSINYPFGSGFVAGNTGVLLNDEMDDFSAKPGVANVYGLVGNDANAIAPGKRMLSSMSPTFYEVGDVVTILGTPGGSRIISMVLQGILAADGGEPVSTIVARGRFHHQYLPDRIDIEPDALDAAVVEELQRRGHAIRQLDRPYGNMQVVRWDLASGAVDAAADPRGIGQAILFDGARRQVIGAAARRQAP